MQHVLVLIMLAASTPAAGQKRQEPSPDPTFLDTIRVEEARPGEGELTFTDPEGELRTLREGDYLEEVDGAKVERISRTTLVLRRVVQGADGQEGEALVVVRFDGSGRTKVREYRTVPDVSPRTPRRRHDP